MIAEGKRLDRFGIPALLGGVSGLLFFWNLGRGSLQDWDEATYAEVSREIFVFHDWLHLHWNYLPWYNKAPLYVWLTAGLYHFGINPFTARAVSALSGVGLVLVTYAIARHFYGRLTAIVSAIVLASCYQFIAAGRFGTSDMLLALFLYAGLYAFIRASERPSWWYAVGIFTGLAIMTKGPAALVGPAAIAITLLLQRKLGATFRTPQFRRGIAVALMIAVPWHVVSFLHYGPRFFDQYLGAIVIDRIGQPVDGHDGNLLTYLAFVRNQFFPWAYLVPFALFAFVRARLKLRDGSQILVAFPAVVFLLYTAVQTKLVWYILPVYPALAIMVAALLVKALEEGTLFSRLAVALAAIASVISVPSSIDPLPPIVLLAVLGLAALIVTHSRSLKSSLMPALVGLAAAFFVLIVGVRAEGLYTSGNLPVVSIARAARNSVSGKPVGIVLYIANPDDATDLDVSHSLLFYSHRPVRVAVGPRAFEEIVGCHMKDVVLAVKDLPSVPARYRLSAVHPKPPLARAAATPVTGC